MKKGVNWKIAIPMLILGPFALIFILVFALDPIIPRIDVPEENSSTKEEKAATKTDFEASAQFTGTTFIVKNLDKYDCVDSKLEINGGVFSSGYVIEGYTLESGETYEVGALQFAKKDGTRFNPLEVKPLNFYIDCGGNNPLYGASWEGNLK